MTIFPTNSHQNTHQNDARHHYSPHPSSNQPPTRLDPSPMLDLLQADPQQYHQLLSRLLIEPRQKRKNYNGPESAHSEGSGAVDTRNPPGQDRAASMPSSQGWSSATPSPSFNPSSPFAPSPQTPRDSEKGAYGQAQRNGQGQQHRPSQPSQPSKPTKPGGIRHSWMQYLVAGGCILSALALMTDVQSLMPSATVSDFCQRVVKTEALLSREHLAQLLAVSERSPKSSVQQVIAEPYCQLPTLELRAGVPAEREAYPLAFDPDTWFVVLYEDGEYAGFDFSFRK